MRDMQAGIPRPRDDKVRSLLLWALCSGPLQDRPALRRMRATGDLIIFIFFFSFRAAAMSVSVQLVSEKNYCRPVALGYDVGNMSL